MQRFSPKQRLNLLSKNAQFRFMQVNFVLFFLWPQNSYCCSNCEIKMPQNS